MVKKKDIALAHHTPTYFHPRPSLKHEHINDYFAASPRTSLRIDLMYQPNSISRDQLSTCVLVGLDPRVTLEVLRYTIFWRNYYVNLTVLLILKLSDLSNKFVFWNNLLYCVNSRVYWVFHRVAVIFFSIVPGFGGSVKLPN